MKQKRPEYNFIKDPHLAYFIQSPYKVAQMLKTRRFKLKENMLIQVDTNDTIEISPYVLKRLDLQQVNKLSEFDNLNKKIMQLIQSGCDVKEKFSEFRMSSVKLSQQISHQTNQQVTKSPQKAHKHVSKSLHGKTLPYIKGLKQFKLKIL